MHTPTYMSLVGLGTWLGFLKNNPATCSKLLTLSSQHSLPERTLKLKKFFFYFVEYYSAIKRNKVLLPVTAGMNLQEITLSEKLILKGYMLADSLI